MLSGTAPRLNDSRLVDMFRKNWVTSSVFKFYLELLSVSWWRDRSFSLLELRHRHWCVAKLKLFLDAS
jgi:hypothetical protein